MRYGQSFFNGWSGEKAFAKAEEVYSLFEAKDRLKLVTPDAPHDFPEAERKAAYELLDGLLK